MTEQERQIRRSDRLRVGVILALCLIVAVPVMVAVAASPDPSATDPSAAVPAATSAPAATTKPDASAKPDKGPRFGNSDKGDRGGFGGGHGAVTITAIDGNKLSLKTDDGWTRTITVPADATVSKAGVAAKLSALSVGDKITFRQKHNDDGTYTITAIGIPSQKINGEVTAIDGNKVTVKRRNGETQVVTLTGSTEYHVGAATGAKASVKVGSKVAIRGELDGTTFTALRVDVQLTVVAGEVTKKTTNSITVTGRDGKAIVIHVTASTKFRVLGKKDGTIADVAVGDKVVAAGVARADGSIDAQALGSGKLKNFKLPNASDAPDA